MYYDGVYDKYFVDQETEDEFDEDEREEIVIYEDDTFVRRMLKKSKKGKSGKKSLDESQYRTTEGDWRENRNSLMEEKNEETSFWDSNYY